MGMGHGSWVMGHSRHGAASRMEPGSLGPAEMMNKSDAAGDAPAFRGSKSMMNICIYIYICICIYIYIYIYICVCI